MNPTHLALAAAGLYLALRSKDESDLVGGDSKEIIIIVLTLAVIGGAGFAVYKMTKPSKSDGGDASGAQCAPKDPDDAYSRNCDGSKMMGCGSDKGACCAHSHCRGHEPSTCIACKAS